MAHEEALEALLRDAEHLVRGIHAAAGALGIGASAGGLEAFKELITGLPDRAGMRQEMNRPFAETELRGPAANPFFRMRQRVSLPLLLRLSPSTTVAA